MASLSDWKARARFYWLAGPAWTGLVAGEIIASCGLIPFWPGVAEAWMVTTDFCRQYPFAFCRAAKRGLHQTMRDMRLWRVQVSIARDHWVSQKWIGFMGFAFEGEMPRYGPDGGDYLRYARVIHKEV